MERKRMEAQASTAAEAEARLVEEELRPSLHAAEQQLTELEERLAHAMAEVRTSSPPLQSTSACARAPPSLAHNRHMPFTNHRTHAIRALGNAQ